MYTPFVSRPAGLLVLSLLRLHRHHLKQEWLLCEACLRHELLSRHHHRLREAHVRSHSQCRVDHGRRHLVELRAEVDRPMTALSDGLEHLRRHEVQCRNDVLHLLLDRRGHGHWVRPAVLTDALTKLGYVEAAWCRKLLEHCLEGLLCRCLLQQVADVS